MFNFCKQMGFEAHVASGMGPVSESKGKSSEVAVIRVLGMTCNSCVQNIEGVMGEKAGIHSISVSLEKEEAGVTYDPHTWTPQSIADAVDDVCVHGNH